MIDIKDQWAIQIDVTNKCNRLCSNCTRMLGHIKEPFYMSTKDFRNAVEALKNFPTDSPPPTSNVKNKMVGILGGEPLMHPQFEELAKIMAEIIPEKKHRGVWTGIAWEKTKYASLMSETFGLIHNNQHTSQCLHSPVLVAIKDVVEDREKRTEMISNCWLQRIWSGTVTPKGLFFCEVAGAMDILFDGPGGLPVEKDCWKRPISDFQSQITRWCNRCGIAMNLMGRKDSDQIDDISQSNLDQLKDSPQIKKGLFELYQSKKPKITMKPWEYR